MKLIFCKKCGSAFGLRVKTWKWCDCPFGKDRSGGRYLDATPGNAEYCGKYAIPFAVDNYSFNARAKEQTDRDWFYDALYGKGKIQAWIMKEGNPNFEMIKKVKNPDSAIRRLGACGSRR